MALHRTNQSAVKRARRHARVRARVHGTATRPRLSVFRSNRFLYAQLIDDGKAATLASASTKGIPGKTPRERAHALGKAIAQKAKAHAITAAVFDRGGYLYTGKVRAIAEGAREGGLTM